MRISIRQRLTAWYAAALLAGLCVFGFSVWVSLRQRLIAGVDERLAQRLEGVKAALGAEAGIRGRGQLQQELNEYAHEVPDGGIVQLWDPAGAVLLPSGSRQVVARYSGRTAPYTEFAGGQQWRVAAARLESAGSVFEAQAAIPLGETLAVMRDLQQLALLLIPAVLLVSCLGGYWLSSRALRPVDEITTVARSIGVQNLSQRVAVPRTGDEIERMAQAWNEVLERLDVSVKRIRQFTSDASHELRTPLALIRATAELALRREREPEEYRASLRQIEREAGSMTALTESLLTMARADSDGLGMVLQPINLNDLARSVVEQNAAIASQKGLALFAVSSGRTADVAADPSGIRRVLLILLDNALKHTAAGGTITVSVEDTGASVRLSVEDTGSGIPAEALPHVFERFYRADAARGAGSGFGLGLSIAQAIAQAHGSSIEVSSKVGAGSRFVLGFRQFSDAAVTIRP